LPVPRAFFYISLEPSFVHLSKSTVNEPASRFLNEAPMERDAFFQCLPLHILQGPQKKEPPFQVPLTELP
jgi:hypothetical protein